VDFAIITINGQSIAEVTDNNAVVENVQEAAELLMNCIYQGTNRIILSESNLPPGFFDLKTKIAGGMLQKFSTYQGYLAIIGDFTKYSGKSLKDFIYESNKTGRVSFVSSRDEALEALLRVK